MKWSRVFALLLISAVAGTAALSAALSQPDIPKPDLAGSPKFRVLSAVDGDTINVIRNESIEKIRLIGVDTPETSDPDRPVEWYGPEAAEFTDNLLRGEQVFLEIAGEDEFGRTLAHVYCAPDGLWVNLELVRQGYGQVYREAEFADRSVFDAYQKRARDARKGLWNGKRKALWEQENAPKERAQLPVQAPPAPPPPETEEVQPKSITVYVTRTGSKYHRGSCSYLRASKIPIDLREAKRRYGACSRCRPG